VKPQAAQQAAQQAGGIGKKSAAEVELEKDEKYRRLMGQVSRANLQVFAMRRPLAACSVRVSRDYGCELMA
jgi:hypothetical protein